MTPEIPDAARALAPARRRLVLGLIALSALSALLLTACDASVLTTAPSTLCAEVGAQCPLPTGPLGVCERMQCPAGATGPCYACISQH